MIIAVIGASSKQMRSMRQLQDNSEQEAHVQKYQSESVEIDDGDDESDLANALSITAQHKKVEQELEEKQKRIASMRGGPSSAAGIHVRTPNRNVDFVFPYRCLLGCGACWSAGSGPMERHGVRPFSGLGPWRYGMYTGRPGFV